MFKFVTLIKKKEGITRDEFIEYYEKKHIPFLLETFPEFQKAVLYRRNYLRFGDAVSEEPDRSGDFGYAGFDVVNEVMFPKREDAIALMDASYKNAETYRKVLEDEDQFVERGHVKMYVVDVYETFA